MKSSRFYNWLPLMLLSTILSAQNGLEFTRQDSLRGTITKEREWWDVLKYEISVKPEFYSKTLEGTTTIHFKVITPESRMQIDLQQPMQVDKIEWKGKSLSFLRDGNVVYIHFDQMPGKGTEQVITISFSGKPREAINPPWDGGWIWEKDLKGRPWMSVACQGLGASVWYPCKDHQSDEPDRGATISITVPDTLMAVANGKLGPVTPEENGWKTYTWTVTAPINNYNIVPYIGKYVNWGETYAGKKGNLDCSYWVLDYELEKAKKQFRQVPEMLACFEHWLGPYPFYEDGFKLVQSPHLGMEHQSAIAYGNGFQNGYLGSDLSQTGWGLKWDFIIIHEAGHEWFGNNITAKDIADMWIHESFTSYTESLFTECQSGKNAATEYIVGTRQRIENDVPVIGTYGVNHEGSIDMYFKGANMIHMIRQIIDDDQKFRDILTGINETFYRKVVSTEQIEEYISRAARTDLSKVFDQYLRTTQIPVLEYRISKGKFFYRWANCIEGFDMPVKVTYGGGEHWIDPTTRWQQLSGTYKPNEVKLKPEFYAGFRQVTDK